MRLHITVGRRKPALCSGRKDYLYYTEQRENLPFALNGDALFFKADDCTHIFEKLVGDERAVSALLVKCAETQEANGKFFSEQSGTG